MSDRMSKLFRMVGYNVTSVNLMWTFQQGDTQECVPFALQNKIDFVTGDETLEQVAESPLNEWHPQSASFKGRSRVPRPSGLRSSLVLDVLLYNFQRRSTTRYHAIRWTPEMVAPKFFPDLLT